MPDSMSSSLKFSNCGFDFTIVSASLKAAPGPYDAINHKMIEIAKMILPAPATKALVFSITLIATF